MFVTGVRKGDLDRFSDPVPEFDKLRRTFRNTIFMKNRGASAEKGFEGNRQNLFLIWWSHCNHFLKPQFKSIG